MIFREHKASEWGGYSGDHFLKALSGTKLEGKDLVIREAIQNSYDAAIDRTEKTVVFDIRGYDLKQERMNYLANHFPHTSIARSFIDKIREYPFCIEIRDSNTTGLAGDYYPKKDENGKELPIETTNYRNFVFNMGGDKNSVDGGAYGVGKTAYFSISKAKIICIYTRTIYAGEYQSRLIFKGFYSQDSESLPVQYWYGSDESLFDIAMPVLDNDADEIASSIGLRPYQYNGTGTSILIFGVDFNDSEDVKKDSREVFKTTFPQVIQHWFWTKLSDECPLEKKIDIHLYLDGEELTVCELATDSPYFYFERALAIWRKEFSKIKGADRKAKYIYDFSSNKQHIIPIKCKRPEVLLGMVAYVTTDLTDKINCFMNSDGCKNNLCVAYMRDVEFVVKYKFFSFPLIPNNKCIFAVFHTDPESSDGKEAAGSVDRAFRNAEDKTHEDWLINNVFDRERTYVKKALEEIPNSFNLILGGGVSKASANAASNRLLVSLGRLLPSKSGRGISMGDAPIPASSALGKTGTGSKSGSEPDMKDLDLKNAEIRHIGGRLREVTCTYTPSKPSSCQYELIPYVKTFDGNFVPRRRVKILSVYAIFSNGSAIRVDASLPFISFNAKCIYQFKFQIEGDVDFGCKARIKK